MVTSPLSARQAGRYIDAFHRLISTIVAKLPQQVHFNDPVLPDGMTQARAELAVYADILELRDALVFDDPAVSTLTVADIPELGALVRESARELTRLTSGVWRWTCTATVADLEQDVIRREHKHRELDARLWQARTRRIRAQAEAERQLDAEEFTPDLDPREGEIKERTRAEREAETRVWAEIDALDARPLIGSVRATNNSNYVPALIRLADQLLEYRSDCVRRVRRTTTPFECTKTELLEALGKHRSSTHYLDQLINAKRLELTKVEDPVGDRGYLARFADPEEHARVVAAIEKERGA